MSKKAINKLKAMLVKKNNNSKWLAEKFSETEVAVPMWRMTERVSAFLKNDSMREVNVDELLNDNKK